MKKYPQINRKILKKCERERKREATHTCRQWWIHSYPPSREWPHNCRARHPTWHPEHWPSRHSSSKHQCLASSLVLMPLLCSPRLGCLAGPFLSGCLGGLACLTLSPLIIQINCCYWLMLLLFWLPAFLGVWTKRQWSSHRQHPRHHLLPWAASS